MLASDESSYTSGAMLAVTGGSAIVGAHSAFLAFETVAQRCAASVDARH
jgi:hypothetical protein